MKAEYINPFLQSTAYTLIQFGEENPHIGEIVAKDAPIPTFQVGIFLGLVGDLIGEIIFSMNSQTGRGLASRMMGRTVEKLTELEHSALGEFGNIAAGGGSTRISSQGLRLNLSPPIVVVGDDVAVRTHKVKTIAVKIVTSFGDIEVNVGLAPKQE
jgi:chemotaxis protein CheX